MIKNVHHPKGIIFIDLHQLAFIDMEHSATQALRIAGNWQHKLLHHHRHSSGQFVRHSWLMLQ
jgi:hypothetical protein